MASFGLGSRYIRKIIRVPGIAIGFSGISPAAAAGCRHPMAGRADRNRHRVGDAPLKIYSGSKASRAA
jgi:hypothetical protein